MLPMTDRPTIRPTVENIQRHNGVAGQYAYTALVTYPDEAPGIVTFTGNIYGQPGPVVMVTATGMQAFVVDPSRFGSRLTAEWVRRFFA